VAKIPPYLSTEAATVAGFKGIVRHPVTFRADLESIMAKTAPKEGQPGKVVIVGGGKSAQEYDFFFLYLIFFCS
jgi:hypothetical protein